jgi:ABC-type multidrug transport system fused ATPase/permease subunit
VAFKYEWGTQVFDDFSLKIKGSKKTAFVWPSGCGKSTIIKLIAGYIHANNGTISVDEQILPGGTFQNKLTSVNLKSYYPHIGYLTQESSVFDGTVFENLIYGLSDKDVLAEIMKLRVADPEGLRHHPLLSQVISQAKCEFIYNFPDGLGTEIWEKWVKLSGGQKQRLAIAKIFLKNPDIILLDEPTSALDSFSEEEVGKALDNLFKNRTVIVVAHRLQTVKQADEIIVLKEWKIAERGRHKELVASGGIYAKMLELQSGF